MVIEPTDDEDPGVVAGTPLWENAETETESGCGLAFSVPERVRVPDGNGGVGWWYKLPIAGVGLYPRSRSGDITLPLK